MTHEGQLRVVSETIEFGTPGNGHIEKLTNDVMTIVVGSAVANGTVTIFAPGATGAITTIEFEPGVVADVQELFDTIAGPDRHYAHNDNLGDGNGHSHVRAGLLGPSLTVPIVGGKMTLGRWQEIVFCDFDAVARQRSIVVQVMGI